MLRSIGKQSGKTVESVLVEKEKEGYGGKDLQKGRAWNKRARGDEILLVISINVSSITTV